MDRSNRSSTFLRDSANRTAGFLVQRRSDVGDQQLSIADKNEYLACFGGQKIKAGSLCVNWDKQRVWGALFLFFRIYIFTSADGDAGMQLIPTDSVGLKEEKRHPDAPVPVVWLGPIPE